MHTGGVPIVLTFHHSQYMSSYQASTSASVEIINSLTKAHRLDDGVMYFAPRVGAAFAATLSLILDLCHTSDGDHAQHLERSIRQGIELLQ